MNEGMVGTGCPTPPRRSRSGPKSPAKTKGPHINTTRFGLSGVGSTRSVFGKVSATASPFFHVRFNSIYEPGAENIFSGFPLTRIANPSPAHEGRRKTSVNCLGVATETLRVAESPSGKVVSNAMPTPADCQFAVEGA